MASNGLGQGKYSVWKTDMGMMIFKSSHFLGTSPDTDKV